MYAPITSEITLGIGSVLREISTGILFTAVERIKPDHDISGEEVWKIVPMDPEDMLRQPRILTRQELSEWFFAEED